MRLKLVLLSALVIGSGGCVFKGKLSAGGAGGAGGGGAGGDGPSGPVAQTKKVCKKELGPIDTLNIPCILDGQGNSEHVGEVFAFTCRAFDLGKYTIGTWGSDPFPINT